MAAGIQELDRGIVQRDKKTGQGTWHNIPSYVVQDGPVTVPQARDVMCYPLHKERLFRGNGQEVDAWAIVRTDHDAVMVDAVGSKFQVVDNNFLLNFVNEHLLCVYPELKIESCGTLFNGATAFVNIKVAEFQIKGDQSPTINRLMYYNPLGKGSYQACAHDVRIVCNNTLRAAAAQGLANKSLAKFRHTASATEKINDHLMDLAELHLHLKKHVDMLDSLTSIQMNQTQVTTYLDKLYPLPVQDNGKQLPKSRAFTMQANKRDAVLNVFNSDQGLDADTRFTAYGMLQATTNVLDHGNIKNGDAMACSWDGITGQRAAFKDTALKILLGAAA